VFAIIISEKGGAERREAFDKNEINVGRVQGNDLMLPKGNVSKHHARLLFRDGRFIVTDLKSTNGTYVNGRKIAQATIVREGDKIYIGDFVLRLETNGATASPEGTASEEESIRTIARDNQRGGPLPPPPAPVPPPAPAPVAAPPPPAPVAVTLKAPTHPPGAPLPRPQAANVSNAPPPMVSREAPTAGYDHDPDDSAPAIQRPRGPSAAPPPMPPPAPRPMTMPLNQMAPPIIGQRMPTNPPMAPPPIAQPSQPPPAPTAPPPQPPPAPAAPAAQSQSVPPPRQSMAPARQPPKETPGQAGRRLTLTMLMGRIGEAVDLSPLRTTPIVPDGLAQQIERAAREQAQAMREEGEAPPDVDLDAVVRDAHRELVGLGAFGPLLEDEDVSEIHCLRFDQVYTLRGSSVTQESTAFSNEEALYRVIARLAHQSGEAWSPGETVIERRLPRASVVAVAPPTSAHHVVSIRKRRRVESSLEELVRANAMSRAMAQFLEACVASHANVLVTGTAPLHVLAALAAGGSSSERACVVQDVEEIATGAAHAVMLSMAGGAQLGEDCVRAAARLRPDRLVVTHLAGGVAAATVDAMAEGVDGVLAALSAPTMRQGLSRLVAQLVLHRPGLSLDGMRDVVGEAFDLAVEVGTLADGRLRVVRIAELGGSDAKGIVARDVFVFQADPQTGDGNFTATGVVPRIANDLAARGMKLDGAMFKRGGR
jgi:pilus assembly protein CpaF